VISFSRIAMKFHSTPVWPRPDLRFVKFRSSLFLPAPANGHVSREINHTQEKIFCTFNVAIDQPSGPTRYDPWSGVEESEDPSDQCVEGLLVDQDFAASFRIPEEELVVSSLVMGVLRPGDFFGSSVSICNVTGPSLTKATCIMA